MSWQHRTLHELFDAPDPVDDEAPAFRPLHWMVAGVFLAAGAEAALGPRRGLAADEVRWAPLLVAPLAGVAQIVRTLRPSPTTRLASQLLNGAAMGVGAVGAAISAWSVIDEGSREWGWSGPRRRPLSKRVPSLAPITFGAAGALGLLIDRQQRADAVQHRRLERRARLIERIVPKPRTRVDRIVVHV